MFQTPCHGSQISHSTSTPLLFNDKNPIQIFNLLVPLFIFCRTRVDRFWATTVQTIRLLQHFQSMTKHPSACLNLYFHCIKVYNCARTCFFLPTICAAGYPNGTIMIIIALNNFFYK